MHEIMMNEWKRDIPEEENALWDRKTLGLKGLEYEREVWEDEKMKTIERDRGEMKKNRTDPLYRKVIKLDRSRGVKI